MSSSFEGIALFEHRFWLQVLGDHARFIFHALSPKEKEDIKRAKRFIETLDQLLVEARVAPAESELKRLTLEADRQARTIRDFKRDLLKKHLCGNISIGLSETFLNHMINEVEEYIRILAYLSNGKIPPKSHPIHHHLIWVSDAAAHAGIITSSLDNTEKRLQHESQQFEKHFQHFYLKAIEIAGYLRTNLDQFPALARFNDDVRLELKIFRNFLRELEGIGLSEALLGIFTPLMADHMAREECYYLMKLAESAGTPPPSCDPTKPRVTDM